VSKGSIEQARGGPGFEELKAIVDRTDRDNPSKKDLTELRRMLDKYPEMWRIGGDMARQAVAHLVKEGIKGTAFLKESLSKGLPAIRTNLGYNDVPEIERLLIEQVALCWLRLNLMEYRYTALRNEGGMTIDQANFLEKRLNYAQRRFLRACEVLARVRRITRRTLALQVNIAAAGGQQVNVAGDVKREGAVGRR